MYRVKDANRMQIKKSAHYRFFTLTSAYWYNSQTIILLHANTDSLCTSSSQAANLSHQQL